MVAEAAIVLNWNKSVAYIRQSDDSTEKTVSRRVYEAFLKFLNLMSFFLFRFICRFFEYKEVGESENYDLGWRGVNIYLILLGIMILICIFDSCSWFCFSLCPHVFPAFSPCVSDQLFFWICFRCLVPLSSPASLYFYWVFFLTGFGFGSGSSQTPATPRAAVFRCLVQKNRLRQKKKTVE